jgi:polyisoprenoid-binding protein YceI
MNTPSRAALAVLIAVGAATASGSVHSTCAQAFATESGTVEFLSRVPIHSFRGTSHELVGRIALADSTVDFYVDLETLDTGNGKRDKDMRKTLDTKEFPFAEFFGKLVSSFDPAGGMQTATVRGTFTIHGVSQEIEVTGTLEPVGGALTLAAEWEMRLEDYDIVPPRLLFIKVDQVQLVNIRATLQSDDGS